MSTVKDFGWFLVKFVVAYIVLNAIINYLPASVSNFIKNPTGTAAS